MLFDPLNNNLYTTEGIFIKSLHCPRGVSWKDLEPSVSGGYKRCNFCKSNIIDTSKFTGVEVLKMAMADQNLCVKVDFTQNNIRIKNVYS